MWKINKYLYFTLFALFAIWSIWSLPYSPIAWYDEVYYASTTHSLINGNGLSLEIYDNEPVLLYGPVYFWITGAITKIFGFGIFTFRIANCIFAFLTVLVFAKILGQLNVNKGISQFLQLVFITDVVFFSNSHSGRMEFVALFFLMLAYWYYLRKDQNKWTRSVLIPVLITISMLTTPRIVFMVVSLAIAEFLNLVKVRHWSCLCVYALIPFVLYGTWIYFAFGSIGGVADYLNRPDQSSQVSTHFGGNFHVAFYHYPMVITSLLVLFYSIKKKVFTEILLFLAPIVLFYLFVYDFGIYIAFILPFYMILIAWGLSRTENMEYLKINRILRVMAIICLVVNCSVAIIKGVTIISSIDQRSPYKMAEWYKKNIPAGTIVAGDYAFYYAAIDNDNVYKSITMPKKDASVVFNNLKTNYHPEYIILSQETSKLGEKKEFSVFAPELISTYDLEDNGLTQKSRGFVKHGFNSSYKGFIYKVH